mmetsp:Transcript_2452/g.5287  ORF Transcript_2452/g.5287 Transcript_2452/m.5287 type:complete len:448 (+) Transcript_2452:127-1470(+)
MDGDVAGVASSLSAAKNSLKESMGLSIGAVPKVSVPIFETEEPFGKVTVEQPETTGGTMQRHTTYMVCGVLGETQFSARKRYSDFEWLRKALVSIFPGVFVPPLPKKQIAGRFEDSFIESRRAGLEEFLQRCFRRPPLVAGEIPLLLQFLLASEDAMEELKRRFDARPVVELWKEYKLAFAELLKTASADSSAQQDKGNLNFVTECTMFLDSQVVKLRELQVSLSDVTQAQHRANTFLSVAQKNLANVCSDESGVLADAKATEQPRVEMLAALRQQHTLLEDAPALHYDILLAAVERELDDAESMHEGLTSLTKLQHRVGELKSQVENLITTKRRVEESDDKPSMLSGLGSIFQRKDKATQLEELAQSLEQTRGDVVAAEEWFLAARVIVVSKEMKRYLAQKVEVHKWASESFARSYSSTTQKLANVWSALGSGSLQEDHGSPSLLP